MKCSATTLIQLESIAIVDYLANSDASAAAGEGTFEAKRPLKPPESSISRLNRHAFLVGEILQYQAHRLLHRDIEDRTVATDALHLPEPFHPGALARHLPAQRAPAWWLGGPRDCAAARPGLTPPPRRRPRSTAPGGWRPGRPSMPRSSEWSLAVDGAHGHSRSSHWPSVREPGRPEPPEATATALFIAPACG